MLESITEMTKPLKLYKASAGSGKTFTLATEYIKLLIQNPDKYRNILAVTFTNKATGEMKRRILSTLFAISNGLEDGEDYLEAIRKDKGITALNLDNNDIRKRCGIALDKIIHDYSRFRIETIDSFFQSIIRELTRELDLTANLRVDLNSEEVLVEAVNTIIDELDKRGDVFESVLNFVREKIENGGNWQINKEVSEFGKNIFKEDYLRNQELITQSIRDAKKLREYKSLLNNIKRKSIEEIKKQGEGFLSEMSASGVDFSDISNGERYLGSFIRKLVIGDEALDVPASVNNFAVDVTKMLKKTTPEGKKDAIMTTIHPLLCNIVNKSVPEAAYIVNTVNAIIRHLNQLMLLNVINEKVRCLNTEANRFLLADSAHFLNEIIDRSDVPFIYEKAGTRFDHIMIDEFQDTSALQWENFKPLIQNSTSNGNSCLIVGDVKQSIYRWRDSDWQILNKKIYDDFNSELDDDSLDTNYRSAGNVVAFNNQFFTLATQILNEEYKKKNHVYSEDLQKAYNDVRQEIPSKKKGIGYVCIDNYIAEDYSGSMPERLFDKVIELHENGIDWNDMTILVRFNYQIPVLCQFFYEHREEIGTKIVSDEAFRLDSSTAINLIILALTCINNPNDRFALSNLALHYQMVLKKDEGMKNNATDFFLADEEVLKTLLPPKFLENIETYTFTPLHELIEELYEVLNLQNIEGQDAYLFFFHDQITQYVRDNQTDIESFLNYWEEKLCSKTIPNGASDGIRIMSLHKSKGLEFHTVIMPYCDWGIAGDKRNLIWCQPTTKPFNELPYVPVSYDKKLDDSMFVNEYREEILRNNVDNLNLVYVGFTRASKNLIVLTGAKSAPKSDSEITTVQHIVTRTMQKMMCTSLNEDTSNTTPVQLEEEAEGDCNVWSFGCPIASEEKSVKQNSNILEKKPTDIITGFIHKKSNIEFRQSNDSKKIVMGEEDEDDSLNTDYVKRGNIYHKIFELIKTRDDVDDIIDTLDGKGYFENVLSVDEARKNIKAALENPIASHWFDEGWREFKECTIMFRNHNGEFDENRPDRVIVNSEETIVIDYKSGRENKYHQKQVSWYMHLLHKMGHKNIKGYVWYFMDNKIVEVKNEKGGNK